MKFQKDIFPGKKLIFIAEIGLNHNGNIALARDMVRAAKYAGADAVKFQTFIPENMNSVYTSSLVKYGEEKEPGSSSERDFFKQFVLSGEEYKELIDLSAGLGIEFFSSPFDPESVDLLEDLNVRFYKIASSEVTNHLLLKKIASVKKPVIMSAGISNENEISAAIDILKAGGTPDIILMHCVSLYPLPPESANLRRIISLRNRFGLETGFSDHTKDNRTCGIAAALGAKYFEKHFTLNRELDCPDKALSLTPEEFKAYRDAAELADRTAGSGAIDYDISEKEVAGLARRSLFAGRTIPKGKVLTYDDIIPKRPGMGMPVYSLDAIIGKKANREIKKDYLLKEEYFE